MKRIWFVYWVFVFAALWDLGLTLWNLHYLNFGFEGNPIIRNWFIAVCVKTLACVIFVKPVLKFEDKRFIEQVSIIGTFLMLIIGQLYGGITHIPFLIRHHESTNTVVGDKNVTFTIQGQQVTYNVPASFQAQIKWYFTTLGVLFVWPYLYLLLSTWLTLWMRKDLKDDIDKLV